MSIELLLHSNEILPGGVVPKFRDQELHELPGRALCLKQKRTASGTSELFQQAEHQRSFSHARFCYQGKKTDSSLNATDRRTQGLSVGSAQGQERRVG